MIDPQVCVRCVNRHHDVCDPCTREGRFRYLEPEPLASGEWPPELPPYRELMRLKWETRLALIYLSLYDLHHLVMPEA